MEIVRCRRGSKGRLSEVIFEGTIAAENLSGPFKGRPLRSLTRSMRAREVYVVVETALHPEGEIRGQIR